MLAEALADLKKKRLEPSLCIVGNWAHNLPEEERNLFMDVCADNGIQSTAIFSSLGDVPFKRTAFKDHRNGRCTCQK